MQKSSMTSSRPSQSGGTRPTAEVVKKEKREKKEKKVRSLAENADLSVRAFNTASRINQTGMIQSGTERKRLEKNKAKRALFPRLKPRLNDWFELLADPWQQDTPRCPISYNPMPTNM